MKNKKVICLLVFLIIAFSLSTFAETKKLKSIGNYTFARVRGRIPTQEVMKMLVDRYAADIKYGFDLAGNGDLYLPFMDQLKTATFEERSLPVGDKLIWMLFRSQGKVKVARDLEWAGKKPLDVFVFNVKKDYKNYELIMPRPCGNISLRSITDLELPPAVCGLAVSPAKVNLKDPVTVDVSGSQMAASIEVEAIGPAGAKAWGQAMSLDSPKAKISFDKPGAYTFKARALNAQGKASTCEAKIIVNAPPVCQLTTSCLPCIDWVNKPITFDASGSSDPDGKVVKADFEITDVSGNLVEKFMDNDAPFVWEKALDKPGVYNVMVIVTDDFNAVSEPCRVSLEVTKIKRSFFSGQVGPLFAKGSHGPFIFAKLDWHYFITPGKVDFTLAAGGALALKGDPWQSFFLADALINYHAGPVFFGPGVGFSSASRSDKEAAFELVGNLGFDIFKTEKTIGALTFEFRWPPSKDIGENHKLLLGFRILF